MGAASARALEETPNSGGPARAGGKLNHPAPTPHSNARPVNAADSWISKNPLQNSGFLRELNRFESSAEYEIGLPVNKREKPRNPALLMKVDNKIPAQSKDQREVGD